MIKRKYFWKVTQIGGLLLNTNDETLGIVQRYLKDSYFKNIEVTEETVAEFEGLDISDLVFETDAYNEIKQLDSKEGSIQTIVYNPKTGDAYVGFVDSGVLFVVDVPVDITRINKQQHYETMIEKAKEQFGEFLPKDFDFEKHFHILTYPEFYEG